jgi:hypothetical protein
LTRAHSAAIFSSAPVARGAEKRPVVFSKTAKRDFAMRAMAASEKGPERFAQWK